MPQRFALGGRTTMDGHRFDQITRVLATGSSRRAVLRRLGAGLAGLGLAAVGRGAAEAAPNACASFCADQPGARGAQCRQTCKACAGGPAATCFNAATGSFACTVADPDNCGACGNTCSAGVACANGACSVCAADACPPGCPGCTVSGEGTAVCFVSAGTSCAPCATSADCSPGEVCIVASPHSCGGNFACWKVETAC